jgi:tetratricopeptide (TPR) repeat protein
MPDKPESPSIQPPEVTDADLINRGPYEGAVIVAGAIFAIGVLAVLGSLVFRQAPVPCGNRPFLVAFFALGCACASSLLGGYAAYRGKVGNAGAISLGGGVAVLVVVLLIGNRIWGGTCTDAPMVSVVWGSISGLTSADTVWPDQVDDFDTYQRNKNIPENQTYQFQWIIRFANKRVPVRFEFQHLRPKPKLDEQLQFPNSPPPDSTDTGPVALQQHFNLPEGNSPIVLQYKGPDGSDSKGSLSWWTTKGFMPLQWVADAGPNTTGSVSKPLLADALALFSPSKVYAADNPCVAAKGSPQYEAFLDELGSPELNRQIIARSTLVKGGAGCLNFIRDALKDPSSNTRWQRGVLVFNLTEAVDTMAAQKVQIPGDIYALAATWLYKLGQFDRASHYFNLVDGETLHKNPNLIYYHAYTQSKLGKPADAFKLYNDYQQTAPAEAQTSGAFHTNVGTVLYELGKQKDASGDSKTAHDLYVQSSTELKKAIDINPGIVAAKPQLDLSQKAAQRTGAIGQRQDTGGGR